MKNIKDKLYDKVEFILKEDPASRDSDPYLTLSIYEAFYNTPSTTSFAEVAAKIDCGDLPTFSGISRCRRKIQQEGKYLGTKKQIRKDLEVDVCGQIRAW